MPLLEIVQTHYVNATIRLDESTAEQIKIGRGRVGKECSS